MTFLTAISETSTAGGRTLEIPHAVRNLYGLVTRWIYSPTAYAVMMRIL